MAVFTFCEVLTLFFKKKSKYQECNKQTNKRLRNRNKITAIEAFKLFLLSFQVASLASTDDSSLCLILLYCPRTPVLAVLLIQLVHNIIWLLYKMRNYDF